MTKIIMAICTIVVIFTSATPAQTRKQPPKKAKPTAVVEPPRWKVETAEDSSVVVLDGRSEKSYDLAFPYNGRQYAHLMFAVAEGKFQTGGGVSLFLHAQFLLEDEKIQLYKRDAKGLLPDKVMKFDVSFPRDQSRNILKISPYANLFTKDEISLLKEFLEPGYSIFIPVLLYQNGERMIEFKTDGFADAYAQACGLTKAKK
jgi:hypothetical protein